MLFFNIEIFRFYIKLSMLTENKYGYGKVVWKQCRLEIVRMESYVTEEIAPSFIHFILILYSHHT